MCTRPRSRAEQQFSCPCRSPQQCHYSLSRGLCQKCYDVHSEKAPCGALATGQLDHQAKATDSLMSPCTVLLFLLSNFFSFLLCLLYFLTFSVSNCLFHYLTWLPYRIIKKAILTLTFSSECLETQQGKRAEIIIIQDYNIIILCPECHLQYISTSIRFCL